MRLELLLPFGVFSVTEKVTRIVAETNCGSWGFLPGRRDCVASLVPGILEYETLESGVSFVAVDCGILVKKGSDVVVSVRQAVGGVELGALEKAVKEDFLELDEHERTMHSALARLESSFIRRYVEFYHD
ncbi:MULTISPECIES: F0F1 ATP synthase subunit epsilon [Chlorobium/Pelodictyon group]|uniref:ATP synthase F1, epsilon subunit n=1 Tax=Chlorobium luteolum (strain DSM 273 / BCRC 81028 / 2530) TaxID=319225 RepID=Q3B405_CHLL3|nr:MULTISPECIES: F0F1 ATP synthase subunit epsilon [Chlorobium/Pelodictyon group]ABB23926.1 ATP synthase F1, epsilon subunit [Pelodictyon luteolum DSM 273]TCD47402.1 F0F1 ATP synthase subunit epsilon [Chlorobium sp. N1]